MEENVLFKYFAMDLNPGSCWYHFFISPYNTNLYSPSFAPDLGEGKEEQLFARELGQSRQDLLGLGSLRGQAGFVSTERLPDATVICIRTKFTFKEH